MKHKHKIALTLLYLLIITLFTFYFTVYIDLTPEQRDKDVFGKAVNWMLGVDLAGKRGSIVSSKLATSPPQQVVTTLDPAFASFIQTQLPAEHSTQIIGNFNMLKAFGQSSDKFYEFIVFLNNYYDENYGSLSKQLLNIYSLSATPLSLRVQEGQQLAKVAGKASDLVGLGAGAVSCESLYGAPQSGVGCWDGQGITRCHDGKLILLQPCPNGCQKGTTKCNEQQTATSTISGKVYMEHFVTVEDEYHIIAQVKKPTTFSLASLLINVLNNDFEAKFTCDNENCFADYKLPKQASQCYQYNVNLKTNTKPKFLGTSITLNSDNYYYFSSSDWSNLAIKDPYDPSIGNVMCKNSILTPINDESSSTVSGKAYLTYEKTPELGLYLNLEFNHNFPSDTKPYLKIKTLQTGENQFLGVGITCNNGVCKPLSNKVKIPGMSWCLPIKLILELSEKDDDLIKAYNVELNADNNYFYSSTDWNDQNQKQSYDQSLSNVQCDNGKIKVTGQIAGTTKLSNYLKCTSNDQCTSGLCTELTGKTGPIGPYGQSVTSTAKYCIPCNEELDFEDGGLHFYYNKGFMCNQGLGQTNPTFCNSKNTCVSCDGYGDYQECIEACKQNPSYKFCIPQGCTDNYCPPNLGEADKTCVSQIPFVLKQNGDAHTYPILEGKGISQPYQFVTDSLTLCPGTYTFKYPVGITPTKKQDLVIDCQGSTLKYDQQSSFKTPFMYFKDDISNIVVKNCIFEGFESAIGGFKNKNIAFLNNKFTKVGTVLDIDTVQGFVFDGNTIEGIKFTTPDKKTTLPAGQITLKNAGMVSFTNNYVTIGGSFKITEGNKHVVSNNDFTGGYYEFTNSEDLLLSGNTFIPVKSPSVSDGMSIEHVSNLIVNENMFAFPNLEINDLEKPVFFENTYQTATQPKFWGLYAAMMYNEHILNDPLSFEENYDIANYFINIPYDKVQLQESSLGAFYYTFDPIIVHTDMSPAYFSTIMMSDKTDNVYTDYIAPNKKNKKIYFGYAKQGTEQIKPLPQYNVKVVHNSKEVNYYQNRLLEEDSQTIKVPDMCFQNPGEYSVYYKYYDYNTKQYVDVISPKQEQYQGGIKELMGSKPVCEGGVYKIPCTTDADCPEDYECFAAIKENFCKKKEPIKLEGDTCDQAADCDEGFYCQPQYKDGYFVGGTCLTLPDECTTSDECPEFYSCEESICVLEDNGCLSDQDCAAEKICDEGSCINKQAFVCTDTDIGPVTPFNVSYFNLGVPGIVKGYDPSLNAIESGVDYCFALEGDNVKLWIMEYMCDNNANTLEASPYFCENGCIDGYCKQPCSAIQPCPQGFTCTTEGTENYCKAESPVKNLACVTNEQCPFPAVCEDNKCVVPDEIPECTKDAHCASGEKCQDGKCVADVGDLGDKSCNQDSDCQSGYYCPQYGGLLVLPLCTPLPTGCTDDASCKSNNFYCASDKTCKPFTAKSCSTAADCINTKYECKNNVCTLKTDKLPTGELYYYTNADGKPVLNVSVGDVDGIKAVLLYYDLPKKEITSELKESKLLIGCFGANVEQCKKETNAFTFAVKEGVSAVCSQSCSNAITGIIIEDNAGNQYQYYLDKDNDFYVNLANDKIKSVVAGHPGVCNCGALPVNYCYTKDANDKQGTCKYSYEFCDVAEKVPVCKLKLETCNKDSPFNFCGTGNVCTGSICIADCSGAKKCPEGLTCASDVCIKSGETCVDNSQCASGECKNNICQSISPAADGDDKNDVDKNKKKKKKKDKDCEPKYAQSCYNDAKKQKCINGIQTIKCKPLNDCYRDGGILQITCDTLDTAYGTTKPTCNDGIKNQNEHGVDCGGSCAKLCTPLTVKKGTVPQQTLTPVQPKYTPPEFKQATCYDGIQNQGESGLDCGGPCNACESCFDEIQNQDEEGVDCGGSCEACSSPWKKWFYILVPVVLVIGLLLMLLLKAVKPGKGNHSGYQGYNKHNTGVDLGTTHIGGLHGFEQHSPESKFTHQHPSPKPFTDIPSVHTSQQGFESQLQHYIELELQKGYTKEHVIKNLTSVGWPQDKVEQMFNQEAHTFLPDKYTQQLKRYVTFYKNKGLSLQEIENKLIDAGWNKKTVQEFLK